MTKFEHVSKQFKAGGGKVHAVEDINLEIEKGEIFSPFYENYGADAILSGAEPVSVPLGPPSFQFDADVLEAAIRQDGVKALILCNSSNPCVKVFSEEEMKIIADLAKK